jgi:hypothetical protein
VGLRPDDQPDIEQGTVVLFHLVLPDDAERWKPPIRK